MNTGDIWALVTDGVRARILRGLAADGSGVPGELVSRARSAHLLARLAAHPGTGEQGRVIGLPIAGAGADMDAIRNDTVDFTRETLRLLDQHRLAGDFDRLALVAPAAVLAICRDQIPAGLAEVVILEWAADLTRAGEPALRREVCRALAQAHRTEPSPQPTA